MPVTSYSNESRFVKHISCPSCGSSDANGLYTDGHTFCHKCFTRTDGDDVSEYEVKEKKMSNFKFYEDGKTATITDRNIGSSTCQAYGVRLAEDKHFYPYYDDNGSIVAVKTRNVSTKSFSIMGDFNKATLFGQNLFTKAGAKVLTICEGEIDAMASYVMQGSKFPVVSIRSGAQSAIKDCKMQYEWINSFESIVLSFDSDEAGQQASKQVAELFGSKVKIQKMTHYKDASEYLRLNKIKEYLDSWWSAEQYVPDGIIQGDTLWDLVNQPVEEADVLYPYQGLNDLTYGVRKGELVTITAGSGLGKSQFMREIVYHVLKNTEDNIGLMFLEESVKKTAKSIMSLAIDKPLHLPDIQVKDEELKYAFEDTLGSGRLYLFDHFGSTDVNNIVNRVKYMAKGLGCSYIFLDHISIIVSAQENGDERKALDEIMTKLRMLVQETGIALFVVSHLKRPDTKGHEEGAVTSLAQLRGSGSIAQLSDMVVSLERNGQHEDPIERHTTQVRVLKNRFSGMTGPACSLLYNKQSGRMMERFDEKDL
jgi:twinkle protein